MERRGGICSNPSIEGRLGLSAKLSNCAATQTPYYVSPSKHEFHRELQLPRIERCARQPEGGIWRRWDKQSRSDGGGGPRPPGNRDSPVRASHRCCLLMDSASQGIVVVLWNASAKHG